MTLVPLWCLLFHVIGLHGHIYRHGKSWNGYTFHTYPHPEKKPPIPRDIMVDVINNLGLKLLAIHNEYNENNIAISPYGALSVLIALGEGLEGDAVYEIQQATHIPNDISLIRVGLRDIHRHLKSYFIPKEGFLAGLTLNHENVTLRPEYEDILRFYGYDTATFNNALYPQPETTNKPQSTTEETATTDIQTTTEMGRTDEVDMPTDSGLLKTSTMRPAEITTVPPETTQESTTVTLPQTTEIKMTTVTTTVQMPITTTSPPETTIETTAATTSDSVANTTPTVTETVTTTSPSTQSFSETETTQPVSTTTEVTTTERTTTEEIIEATSTVQSTTLESTQAGTTVENTELTTNIETTTQTNPPSTTELVADGTTLLLPAATTEFSTDSVTSTLSTVASTLSSDTTTASITDSTSTITSTDTSTELTTISTTTSEMSTDKVSTENEIDPSADTTGFGGISKRKVRSGATSSNHTNVVRLNMREPSTENVKRTSRSIVDYIIARSYDDQFNFHNNHAPYIPDEQPSFFMYGKYREYHINFMNYNTVLPFHYEPHLNALALSFPLDSTKYYLLLLLPVDENGIDKLICDLRLNGSIKYIIDNLRYTHVVATIPSFMLKGYVTLTPSFQKLGIRKVFEPRQADFAPMTTQRGIYVTNIEQAITVTIRNYVDPDIVNDHRNLHRYDPVYFKADHPFLYFVIDSDIHVTLMAGKIVNPLNARIS